MLSPQTPFWQPKAAPGERFVALYRLARVALYLRKTGDAQGQSDTEHRDAGPQASHKMQRSALRRAGEGERRLATRPVCL